MFINAFNHNMFVIKSFAFAFGWLLFAMLINITVVFSPCTLRFTCITEFLCSMKTGTHGLLLDYCVGINDTKIPYNFICLEKYFLINN